MKKISSYLAMTLVLYIGFGFQLTQGQEVITNDPQYFYGTARTYKNANEAKRKWGKILEKFDSSRLELKIVEVPSGSTYLSNSYRALIGPYKSPNKALKDCYTVQDTLCMVSNMRTGKVFKFSLSQGAKSKDLSYQVFAQHIAADQSTMSMSDSFPSKIECEWKLTTPIQGSKENTRVECFTGQISYSYPLWVFFMLQENGLWHLSMVLRDRTTTKLPNTMRSYFIKRGTFVERGFVIANKKRQGTNLYNDYFPHTTDSIREFMKNGFVLTFPERSASENPKMKQALTFPAARSADVLEFLKNL